MSKYIKKFEKDILPFLLKSRGLEQGIEVAVVYRLIYGNHTNQRAAINTYRNECVRHLISNARRQHPELAIKQNKVYVPIDADEINTKRSYYHKHINARGINSTKFVIAASRPLSNMSKEETRIAMQVSLVQIARKLKKMAGETNEEKQ